MPDIATYILSAEMDAETFAWLDELRRRHFPPERNWLSAHLTLFHRLSPLQAERLATIDLPCEPPALYFPAPILMGFGVAIRVRSPALERLRGELRSSLGGDFSRQDQQVWSPHVTIQNKVAAEAARRLHQELAQDFAPRDGSATALLLWEYLGGPWRLRKRYAFHVAEN